MEVIGKEKLIGLIQDLRLKNDGSNKEAAMKLGYVQALLDVFDFVKYSCNEPIHLLSEDDEFRTYKKVQKEYTEDKVKFYAEQNNISDKQSISDAVNYIVEEVFGFEEEDIERAFEKVSKYPRKW